MNNINKQTQSIVQNYFYDKKKKKMIISFKRMKILNNIFET